MMSLIHFDKVLQRQTLAPMNHPPADILRVNKANFVFMQTAKNCPFN